MGKLQVRLAEPGDLPVILEVYQYARDFMARQGNAGQWGMNYPPAEVIEADIAGENLYVITKDGAICGVFAFIPGDDPTYAYIEGSCSSDARYGAIHRVAGNGTAKGIFPACVAFCEEKCRYLRIDTHEKNLVMQHQILNQGFSYCGIIYTHDSSPRMAFDRIK